MKWYSWVILVLGLAGMALTVPASAPGAWVAIGLSFVIAVYVGDEMVEE